MIHFTDPPIIRLDYFVPGNHFTETEARTAALNLLLDRVGDAPGTVAAISYCWGGEFVWNGQYRTDNGCDVVRARLAPNGDWYELPHPYRAAA